MHNRLFQPSDIKLENEGKTFETRFYSASAEHIQNGRTWKMIYCPYCIASVKTFNVGLRMFGKRCFCGALFGSSGLAFRFIESPHPVEVLRDLATVVANENGLEVDHEAFDEVKRKLDNPQG